MRSSLGSQAVGFLPRFKAGLALLAALVDGLFVGRPRLDRPLMTKRPKKLVEKKLGFSLFIPLEVFRHEVDKAVKAFSSSRHRGQGQWAGGKNLFTFPKP